MRRFGTSSFRLLQARRAFTPGLIAIALGCSDKSGVAPQVSQLRGLRLEVAPGSKTALLRVGDVLQLQVYGVSESGSALPLTRSTVSFVSRDPATVAVDGNGIVTLKGTGGSFVVAEAAGALGPVRDSVHILYGTGAPLSRSVRATSRAVADASRP